MREKNKFFRIIIENDSLTDIQTIMGVSPMYITTNLVEDINLALQIDNIFFHFCRRIVNKLGDRITKLAHNSGMSKVGS